MTDQPDPSRKALARGDKTTGIARAGEPRYTEEELALILNKAAELQEGGARAGVARYTLAEIQEIAAGAGISASHVAAVAAGLRENRERGSSRFLGAPWRFRFDDALDGEVSDDVVGELIDIARRELGLQGRVSEALGSVEWTGRDSFGATYVTVTRRGGHTTISVLSARTDAAAVTGVLGVTGAVIGSFAFGAILVATSGLAAPLAGLAGIAGGAGGSWLSMRATWQRLARRYTDRTAAVGEALMAAARRAVDDGRVTTN